MWSSDDEVYNEFGRPTMSGGQSTVRNLHLVRENGRQFPPH